MQSFTFYYDRKATVWERETHEIQAETQEEAKKKFIELFEKGELDGGESFLEVTTLYDTLNYITPQENGNQATEEICDEDNALLATNEPTN